MVYCCVSHTFIDKKPSYLAQSLGNDIAKITYMYYEKCMLIYHLLKRGGGFTAIHTLVQVFSELVYCDFAIAFSHLKFSSIRAYINFH